MSDSSRSATGITALAARLGISVETLRYYEQEGLIEVPRTPAGRRVYDAAVQDALAVAHRNLIALFGPNIEYNMDDDIIAAALVTKDGAVRWQGKR